MLGSVVIFRIQKGSASKNVWETWSVVILQLFASILCRNDPTPAQTSSLLRLLCHTHTHTHTPGRNSLNQLSARRTGRYLLNTQQTQEKNIHDPTVIEPAIPASERPQTRPSGHRVRCCVIVAIDSVFKQHNHLFVAGFQLLK